MARGDNAVVAVYEPGDEISGVCTALVNGGRFVKCSADIVGGPFGTENPNIAQCVAGDMAIGVSRYEGAIADVIPLLAAHQVIPMLCGAAVAFNAEVQSDANGSPITLAAGKSLGTALNTTSAGGQILLVKLRLG